MKRWLAEGRDSRWATCAHSIKLRVPSGVEVDGL